MENTQRENKMGTMPIPRLLFSVSVPIIISMIVQALYNVVDSIFVAQYNNDAGTGALTVAFPIQNLLLAISIGLAVGANALLSRYLGQKKFDKVNLVAGQGFFLMGCGYILFLIFGLFFVKFFVGLQVDPTDTLRTEYSVQYITIISIFSCFIFIQVICERLLQATGRSFYSMITQGAGAIVNIILDPILIFGWLGLPEMGIRGAAIATIIGQAVSAALGIVFNLKFNTDIKLKLKNFIPKWEIIKEMLEIGIPAVLMQAIGSVMTFSMNIILEGFSKFAVNVFGVYFKLQSFVFMPIFGFNNGLIPIMSYNYGAGNKKRVMSALKLGLFIAIGYMLLGLLVFQIFPGFLLGFFNAGAEMLEIGVPALRTVSLSFVFAGFSVISISACQALGKSIYSLFVSVGRQLVVLIPAAYLLSLIGEVKYVWWSFPIAEIMSVVLCAIFLIRVLKKSFKPKELPNEK
ncbi:MAG: MATE family efflux transporter [Clostridia bacterium]|nr:MATE family efflux transporter [Clostridia bacterium]